MGTFWECSALTDVYYAGSQSDWEGINIEGDNTYLTSATIHYNGQTLSDGHDGEDTLGDSTTFIDVDESGYYYDAVVWAVANGVTSGTSTNTFSPSVTCTRGQVVTFLWRASGEPTPTSSENPFGDVADDAYYYSPYYGQWSRGLPRVPATLPLAPTTLVTPLKCSPSSIVPTVSPMPLAKAHTMLTLSIGPPQTALQPLLTPTCRHYNLPLSQRW